MKEYVASKIHGIVVTDKSVHYHGSVSIASELMNIAAIEPYEMVHIVNLTNGNRWVTYAIPADPGCFTLNGGGARLGEIGDVCVVMTYRHAESFMGAAVVFCDQKNNIMEVSAYANT